MLDLYLDTCWQSGFGCLIMKKSFRFSFMMKFADMSK